MRDLNAMGRKPVGQGRAATSRRRDDRAHPVRPIGRASLPDRRWRRPAPRMATTTAPTTIRQAGSHQGRHSGSSRTHQVPAKKRRRGRLTVVTTASIRRGRGAYPLGRRVPPHGSSASRAVPAEVKEKVMREVTVPETITIQELANRMSERAVDVIRLLMKQGGLHKITDVIDADTAQTHRRGHGPHGQARGGIGCRGRVFSIRRIQ